MIPHKLKIRFIKQHVDSNIALQEKTISIMDDLHIVVQYMLCYG
ncbi:hypothetical protein NRI_0488 [Neorickettsia risticii str. Illinois]|uniref:Uncharacterized protein n=1 Tax=Neorickettsia risticii (strain Illinois) TaxID=434131 RepID=C6V504_NEORI|nr:hypothetical protein NRI_0488 [Neorickettsia risticii str. Illinois]